MDELKKLLNKFNPFSRLVDFFLNRARLLENTLKEKYPTVLRVGLLFASFLLLLGFYSLQRFENNIDIETESQIIIENIEIPETQQFETPPPPARPSVPVESEDDDLADDLTIEETDLDNLHLARKNLVKKSEILIPPRDAKTFEVQQGEFFRIESVEGPQVGDLNLFNLKNLEEKFYSGKTRALYGTHLSVGDKMFSSFPYLRSLATITWDTLDWYDYDKDGGSVHLSLIHI